MTSTEAVLHGIACRLLDADSLAYFAKRDCPPCRNCGQPADGHIGPQFGALCAACVVTLWLDAPQVVLSDRDGVPGRMR